MDITALRAFVRTVERGSVTGAARDLAISQPAATKHIRNLERHLGARLFERTARSIRPTSQGLAFYQASRTALATLEAALEGVQRDMGAIEGAIRIFAPSCLGSRQLYDAVADFQLRHPAVSVDLVLDMRQVDLVHENFDLAVSYAKPETRDTIVCRIGSVRRILAAAPAFLASTPALEKPADLVSARVVATPAVLSLGGMLTLCRGSEMTEVAIKPALRTNSAEVLVRALCAGRHVGPVQELLVEREVASGTLVRVLPDHEVRTNDVYLSYPSARYMRPAVRAFVDALVPRLKAVEGISCGTAERPAPPFVQASGGRAASGPAVEGSRA